MWRSDVRDHHSSEETIKPLFYLIFAWGRFYIKDKKHLLAFKFDNIMQIGLLQFLRVKLKLHCWFLLKRFCPESFLLLLVSSWSCSTGNMVAPPNDQLRFNQLFQRRISYQRKVIKADKPLQPVELRIFTMGHSGNELLALQHLLLCHEIARTTVSRLLQWRQQTQEEDKSSLDSILSGSSKRHSDHDRQSWQEQTASLCCYEIITQLGANSFCWRGEGQKHWLCHPQVTLETKVRDCWFSPDATDPCRE